MNKSTRFGDLNSTESFFYIKVNNLFILFELYIKQKY